MSVQQFSIGRLARDYRFWLILAFFILISILEYPQLILGSGAPYAFMGMERHAFDRILLLLPIGYAGYIYGVPGSIASLAIAAAIMLPRDFLISEYPIDSLYESSGILVVGCILNLWFHMHRKDDNELKRLNQELNYYSTAVVQAQEDERKRISRDLHDSVAQTLVATLRQLDNFVHQRADLSGGDSNYLGNFEEQVRQALKEVRIISRDLRPSILDDLGLLPALEWLCDQMYQDYGIKTSLEIAGTERKLAHEAELTLFRIIQEAARNVAKHSRASQAAVYFCFNPHNVVVKVQDNGIGFEVPPNPGSLPKSGKLGLAGMHERVRLLGGNIAIESKPGQGTLVSIEAPL